MGGYLLRDIYGLANHMRVEIHAIFAITDEIKQNTSVCTKRTFMCSLMFRVTHKKRLLFKTMESKVLTIF